MILKLKYYQKKYHKLALIINQFDNLVLKEFRVGAPEGPYILNETNDLLAKLRISENKEPDSGYISRTLKNMKDYISRESFKKTKKSDRLLMEIDGFKLN